MSLDLPAASSPSSGAAAAPWLRHLTWLVLALALLRGAAIVLHAPVVALANNYDQIRYTACFDLYPQRPDGDSLQYRSPSALYGFEKRDGQDCYLTSDLLFQGAAVAWFRATDDAAAPGGHSVRVLGALRLLAWMLAAGGLARAFQREGRGEFGLAAALWLLLVGLDPVDSLYLNTFYAEGGAVFFAFCLVGLGVLAALRGTRWRWLGIGLAALALGLSKMQHLALPLFAAAALLPMAWRERRLRSLLAAVALGALPALAFQAWQMGRPGPMAQSIRIANHTDFVLTALLPASADPATTARRMRLDTHCAEARGRSIYTINMPPEQACPGISHLSHLRTLGLFVLEPGTMARMLADVPAKMLPLIPQRLGTVEGQELAPLPEDFLTIDRLIGKRAWLLWLILLAPASGYGIVLIQRHASAQARAFTALCAAIALVVPVVAVIGDGLVELDKHAHLASNAGLAFILAMAVTVAARRRHRPVKR